MQKKNGVIRSDSPILEYFVRRSSLRQGGCWINWKKDGMQGVMACSDITNEEIAYASELVETNEQQVLVSAALYDSERPVHPKLEKGN